MHNIVISDTSCLTPIAKQLGAIENVKPLIDKILATDFRISEHIIIELLKLNDETDAR